MEIKYRKEVSGCLGSFRVFPSLPPESGAPRGFSISSEIKLSFRIHIFPQPKPRGSQGLETGNHGDHRSFQVSLTSSGRS